MTQVALDVAGEGQTLPFEVFPGVCLDEIAIAIGVKGGNIQTILVESQTELRPPATVSYIQWLDMHDWKEHRAVADLVLVKEENHQVATLAPVLRISTADTSRLLGVCS